MKIEFKKDDKQDLITIKQNGNKVILKKRDFERICNYANGTFSDTFNKTQWRVSHETIFKPNHHFIITMIAKDKKIVFKTNNIPKNIR